MNRREFPCRITANRFRRDPITLDGARSWRNFNLRDVLSGVAYDPRAPKVIYVTNNALWKSTDTGRTWALVFPNPAKNTLERMRGDHASQSYSTDDAAYQGVARTPPISFAPTGQPTAETVGRRSTRFR